MLAPLVMRPETDQVFTLFLYLLVVNIAFFGISVLKSWLELRITAFVLTWMMYVVYYLQYTHVDIGWWTMPMRYAIAAFIFYLIAFYAAAWKEKCGYAGINIYSSFANTVVFGLWSASLLDNQMSMTLVLIVIGILYGCMAIVFRPYAGPNRVAFTRMLFWRVLLPAWSLSARQRIRLQANHCGLCMARNRDADSLPGDAS